MFTPEVERVLFPILGTALAILITSLMRIFRNLKFITSDTFREFQTKNREMHNEHFVAEKQYTEDAIKLASELVTYKVAIKNDFDIFKKECIECQKELPEKYATCVEMHRLYDRLEDIHRQDMDVSYKTMKGGFESITTRVDNLIKKEHEKE